MRERSFADDVQSFWAPHEKRFRPSRMGFPQFDSVIAAEQRGDCDLRLQPRQTTTETSVRTGAKSEMGIVPSLEVELFRIRKLEWIAIGGTGQNDDRLARFQRLIEEFVPSRDNSRDSLNGTLESKDFFHCTAHQ